MFAQERFPQHLFIVRIWFERADTWRGQVEHIPSGQKLYFTSLDDLNDFINLRVRQPVDAETLAPRMLTDKE